MPGDGTRSQTGTESHQRQRTCNASVAPSTLSEPVGGQKSYCMSIISSAVFRGGSGAAGTPTDEAALIMRRRNRASGDSATRRQQVQIFDGKQASGCKSDDIERYMSKRKRGRVDRTHKECTRGLSAKIRRTGTGNAKCRVQATKHATTKRQRSECANEARSTRKRSDASSQNPVTTRTDQRRLSTIQQLDETEMASSRAQSGFSDKTFSQPPTARWAPAVTHQSVCLQAARRHQCCWKLTSSQTPASAGDIPSLVNAALV